MAHSVSQWSVISDKVTYWAVCGQLKTNKKMLCAVDGAMVHGYEKELWSEILSTKSTFANDYSFESYSYPYIEMDLQQIEFDI